MKIFRGRIFKSFLFLIITSLLVYFTICEPKKDINREANAKYNPAELQEDYKVFKGSLLDFHPAMNWYLPREDMAILFDSVYKTINKPMDELTFFRKLSFITAKIRCGHLRINPSQTTNDHIWKHGKFLPLELKFIKNKAYCFENFSSDTLSLTAGTEILRINEFSIDSLVKLSSSRNSGDGFIETKKLKSLETYFNSFYAFQIGLKQEYTIEYIDKMGENQIKTIKGLSYRDIYKQKKSSEERRSAKNIALDFIKTPSTALLSVREFNNWKEGGKKIKFQKELDKIFKKLDSSRVSNLIIDLRNNGGGDDELGLKLFSYFYDKPVVEFSKMQYRLKRSKYFKYSDINNFQFFVMTKLMFKTKKIDDSTNIILKLKTLEPYRPSQPSYKGKTYILINGRSFSTTADFSALMRSYGLATFIGSETGGGYYGNSSAITINVKLPNTNIRMRVPTVKYTTNVKPLVPFGRGVIPDYQIMPSIKDQINNIDAEMKFTLQFIEKNQ